MALMLSFISNPFFVLYKKVRSRELVVLRVAASSCMFPFFIYFIIYYSRAEKLSNESLVAAHDIPVGGDAENICNSFFNRLRLTPWFIMMFESREFYG